MDLRIVLLCLGVLSCVQSYQAEIVPALVPRSFTNVYGQLFSTNLGAYPGVNYPSTKWVIRQWVYITSIDSLNSYLAEVTYPSLRFYFESNTFSYEVNTVINVVNGVLLALSKWMYFATGMNGEGNDMFYFERRGESPIYRTTGASPKLTLGTVYQGSSDVENFSVRD